MSSLADLHNTSEIRELIRESDSAWLFESLGDRKYEDKLHESTAKLRLAAYTSLSDLLSKIDFDDSFTEKLEELKRDESISVLKKWSAYIRSIDGKEGLAIEDLLFFSTAGLLAEKPVEVRAMLKSESAEIAFEQSGVEDWSSRVKRNITASVLFLIRQDNHQDIRRSKELIDNLAKDQKELEEKWLSKNELDDKRRAVELLALYHLARAVSRVAEFLLMGSVETDGRVDKNVGPELRRLLSKAEEYFSVFGGLDAQLWLESIAITVWKVRSNSIWSSSRGISDRIDRLLDELVEDGRPDPIFSLLPSQREALRDSFLDPTQVAVVLQMPTSSGKTLLAKFSILQAFEAYSRNARVVYVVPTRALATQTQRTLSEDLGPLGVQVTSASGAFEEDPYELEILSENDGVVVATPEKIDLLLRSQPEWFEIVRLIVVDEAHLLNDGERGARLELLLANIRRESPHSKLLLLTPFIDNASDIASWLGDDRGASIKVSWRPSRLLLGIADISGRGSDRSLTINWAEPHGVYTDSFETETPTDVSYRDVDTARKKLVYLNSKFQEFGTVLGLFTSGKKEAEEAAREVADGRSEVKSRTPEMRVAIALAEDEYGEDSPLASCLRKGVAFHHSSLSSTLRYLIEDQVRAKSIEFISATTTLAQGMNFPVATVLIHSVHKPYGKGDLTPAEFWNIAGRAGRVGMTDKGLIVFVNKKHKNKFRKYKSDLNQKITSSLVGIIKKIDRIDQIEVSYKEHEAIRPFIQYLAHIAAKETPRKALAMLEELIQGSLASRQIASSVERKKAQSLASRYLKSISGKNIGYLRAADQTGLGSFSFDELFKNIKRDRLLSEGPKAVRSNGEAGMKHLIDAIQWLPELSIGLGLGKTGPMNTEAVARVVQGWMDGKSVSDLSDEFPANTKDDRIRKAARYLYSDVSQTISWGVHAYLKSWKFVGQKTKPQPEDEMLGSYVQHGVNSPEAAVASLLGVPRQFATSFGEVYRTKHGRLKKGEASKLKRFVEEADLNRWIDVTMKSSLSEKVSASDIRKVWRAMKGVSTD